MSEKLLRFPEAEDRTGLKRQMIYRLIERSEFPQPVQITKRAIGFRENEIDEWIKNRPRSVSLKEVVA